MRDLRNLQGIHEKRSVSQICGLFDSKEITQNFQNNICLPQSNQQRPADVIIKLILCRPMVGAHVNFQGIQTFCWFLTNLTVEGYASVLVNISYMGLKNI